MKKKILFIPQNKEHVLNMNPIIREIVDNGYTCHYLDSNNIFYQNLNFPKDIETYALPPNNLLKSFYRMSSLTRLRFIFSQRDKVKKLSLKYDAFVFGNDGAIQRQFIYYAKKENKICCMILDGLINAPIPFGFLDVLTESQNKLTDLTELVVKSGVLIISKLFSRTFLSPYLPSVIAIGNLDHIYTIGEFSANEISKYVLKGTKVLDTGLPRMKPYFTDTIKSFTPKFTNSVCFITSAYKWHGMLSYHKYQIMDILLIRKCLDDLYPNENYILYVKLHPRENPHDYIQFENRKGIILVENEPFLDSIFKYNVLLSNLSTCIVEGLNLGVNVGSLMVNFPYWKVKNGFLKNNSINKYFTENELKLHLANQLDLSEVLCVDRSNNKFLSRNTPLSTNLISNKIMSLIKQ